MLPWVCLVDSEIDQDHSEKHTAQVRLQDGRMLKRCESDEQLQYKPAESFQRAHVWMSGVNRRKAARASSSAGNKIARAGATCEGTHGSSTKGDGAS